MNEYVVLLGLLFAFMNVGFMVSLFKKRNDVADVAWGLGFVLMAWASFVLAPDSGTRGWLVTLLVSVWGLRLAWHIHARNRGKAEDYRYLAWRQAWGKWFYVRSYFQVFVLQGALLFVIAWPVIFIHTRTGTDFGLLDWLGTALWIFGFCFEAIGDAELARFLRNPENKGKLMQSGLWAWSRHPNYFGEVTQWWGIWLLALALPGAFLTIIGPLTITFLIMKVSGIPTLEKKMAEHPDFAAYQKKTSLFFPLPRWRATKTEGQ